MSRAGGERGQAHGDVFGTFIARCAVTHPFPSMRDDSLASGYVEHTVFVLDAQPTSQHERELVERWPLAKAWCQRLIARASVQQWLREAEGLPPVGFEEYQAA